MKAKFKLDQTAIKNFFIEHVEKVVFGVVLAGMVMIIYGAVTGREKTEKIPDELSKKVQAAKSKIDEGPRSVDFSAIGIDQVAIASNAPLEVGPYQLGKPLSPPTGKMEHARGMPPVVGAKDLRAKAGSGMFQFIAAQKEARGGAAGAAAGMNAGAMTSRGQRWAVVTALVPFKEQCEAFADTFSDCKKFDRDAVPLYAGFSIQRFEVASPADIDNPNWDDKNKVKSMTYLGMENSMPKDWGPQQPDPIDPQYIDPYLCFPLGPLTEAAWDAKVAHEPEIPFGINTLTGAPMEQEAKEENEEPEKKPAEGDSGFEDRTAATNRGGATPGVGMPGVGMPQMYGPVAGRGMPMGGAIGQANVDPNNVSKYRLLRFFDFSVEPGKRYLYRVRLAVSNPNYKIKAAYLEKPEFAKDKVLKNADWSAKSTAVSIPCDTSALALAVEQKNVKSEPLASMLVAKWQESTGQKVYNKFAVERGQLLNFSKVEVKVPPIRGGLPANTTDKTELVSNMLVVDISGGKKFPPTSKPKPAPEDTVDVLEKKMPSTDRASYSFGDILVMESDGTLVVHNESNEETLVAEYTSTPTQPTGPAPGMQGMPGYGGHGMPPGYGPYGPGMQGPGMQGPGMRGGPGGPGPGYGGLFPPPNAKGQKPKEK